MPSTRPRVLFVTDLTYEARGRRYCDEDIALASRLREDFDTALCHPLDAEALMDAFDAVLIRNSGPVLNYQTAFDAFRTRALATGARVHNHLTGSADMAGKQYLVDLTAQGHPVIPTVDRLTNLERLPDTAEYVIKPKQGADSIGLKFLTRAELESHVGAGDTFLVQPRIDFTYEVSFYFIDDTFQYALHAPHPDKRWVLEPYTPTPADLAFAQGFITWNTVDHGIQRVDACRTRSGELLLVELEDLNPYLSLDLIPQEDRDAFITNLKASLRGLLAG
ncbi:hypothetical protein [Streptomyces sp. BA2]|uniref:hypothetical protein n=1 Tax=Streptomyces sp. BA2 TaxID=436595 RepID=UPI00132B0206|nr:hypothetical protein [Streptomyces sp. BA2]MWA11787.1 hypothetical protein [Streptomyces sp. BA2]